MTKSRKNTGVVKVMTTRKIKLPKVLRRIRSSRPLSTINVRRSAPRGVSVSAINNSQALGSNAFRMSSGPGDIVQISGREVVASVISSEGFNQTPLKLFPIDSSIFPRLSSVARTFQKYRFTKLKWTFCPLVPATTAGQVGVCFQTDSNTGGTGNAPSNLASYPDMPGGNVDSVCYAMSGLITYDREFPWYDLNSSSSEENSSWSTLFVGRDGFSTTGTNCGYVVLEYDIQLKYMQVGSLISYNYNESPGNWSSSLIATEVSNIWTSGSSQTFYLQPAMMNSKAFQSGGPLNTNHEVKSNQGSIAIQDLPPTYDFNLSSADNNYGYLLTVYYSIPFTTNASTQTGGGVTFKTAVQDKSDGGWIDVNFADVGTTASFGRYVARDVFNNTNNQLYGSIMFRLDQTAMTWGQKWRFGVVFTPLNSNTVSTNSSIGTCICVNLTRLSPNNTVPIVGVPAFLGRPIQPVELKKLEVEEKEYEDLGPLRPPPLIRYKDGYLVDTGPRTEDLLAQRKDVRSNSVPRTPLSQGV